MCELLTAARTGLRATHVGTVSPAVPGPERGDVRRTLVRSAILLLLREQEGHGYELASRLAELGLEIPLNAGGLYRSLRTMAGEGLVTSYWTAPERGSPRRVYAITEVGEQHLEQSMLCLEGLLRTVREMLNRYRRGSTSLNALL